jgi:hypothetical protein
MQIEDGTLYKLHTVVPKQNEHKSKTTEVNVLTQTRNESLVKTGDHQIVVQVSNTSVKPNREERSTLSMQLHRAVSTQSADQYKYRVAFTASSTRLYPASNNNIHTPTQLEVAVDLYDDLVISGLHQALVFSLRQYFHFGRLVFDVHFALAQRYEVCTRCHLRFALEMRYMKLVL